jgi:hypothetical protein
VGGEPAPERLNPLEQNGISSQEEKARDCTALNSAVGAPAQADCAMFTLMHFIALFQ